MQPQNQKQQWLDRTLQVIERLARYGISHGDLKHTNILCSEGAVILVDLDVMHVHRAGFYRRYRLARDRKRLLRI
jgi:RIO-like serine/threonine protein kinase